MDVPEPEQTPFMAVTAHTSKVARVSGTTTTITTFYVFDESEDFYSV